MPAHSTNQEVARTVYVPCRVYVWPQSGLDFRPNESAYAVPGLVQTTFEPSPIAHTIRFTFAVAVMLKRPADAVLEMGPTQLAGRQRSAGSTS